MVVSHAAAEEKKSTHAKRYVMSPTGEAFHTSNAFVRAIMGPVGGGKTSTCCMELLFASMRQEPDPDTGIRSVRWAVTRATYNEIEHALLPTFEEWVGYLNPEGWKKAKPLEWRATIPLHDGTTLDIEILFISVGTRDDAAAKFRGLELTGLMISEYSTLSVANFDIMAGRVGRWPKRRKDEDGNVLVECTEPCIIMESNPPSRDSQWFHVFERAEVKQGREIFHQPPAVIKNADGSYTPNPDADNYDNHSGGGGRYYQNQLATMDSDEQIRVYLMGQYGKSVIGNAVWPMFEVQRHVMGMSEAEMLSRRGSRVSPTGEVLPQLSTEGDDRVIMAEEVSEPTSEDLATKLAVQRSTPYHRRKSRGSNYPKPLPLLNRPIHAGMDFGLNSAIVTGQLDDIGRLVILDALWESNCNTTTFIEDYVKPLFKDRYPAREPVIYGDPTGVNRDGNTGNTAYGLLADAGLSARPAPTNNISMRISAVTEFLRVPNGLIIAPHNVELIEAIESDYVLVSTGNSEAKPTKGPASHICDALQYLCLSLRAANKQDDLQQKALARAQERADAAKLRGRRSSSIIGTM